MEAYKTYSTVGNEGQVVLSGLPFQPGSRVEVVVLQQPQTPEQVIESWTASNQRIRKGLRSEISEAEIVQEIETHRANESSG